jgi:hypothetical protein
MSLQLAAEPRAVRKTSLWLGSGRQHTLPPDSDDLLRRCPFFSRTLRNFFGMSELAAFIISILAKTEA